MTIARHTFALTLAAALASATLAACHQDAPADTAPLAVTQPPPVRDAPLGEDARRIAADVNVLADDRMEGRQTGSRGFDLAADHVAARFRAIGLQPAGDDGTYFQAVPLLRATRVAEGAALVVKRNGRQIALRFGDQFLPGLDYDAAEHAIEAPAVFVGQGVHAPELGHDDFAGLDLRGRIAVVFAGAPARFDHPQRALHSAQREKLRAIAARGAIGVVFVNTPQDEAGAPWARAADNWQRPGMRLRGADGKALQEVPGLRATATASAAAADLIFADGPRPAAALFAAAQDGTLKGFALPGTLALAGRTRIEPLTSRNVVARLPGGDAALAGEHLAYTAHLDHVGIGAPVKDDHGVEDRIYNGALDNALGVAILLETARILHAAPSAPKRSLLFAALTGEEQGLLGAEWLVAHPPAAATALVANLNIDMPVLLAPSKDIVPIGAAHSSLQAVVEAAAGEVPVALSPDPFPEDVAFVRSDQYAFVRAGIPAVYLAGGVESADGVRDPRLALRKFMLEHYHQPSDEPSLPIAYGDAARLARLNARIGQRVADAAQRPAWKAGDLFGTRFTPVSAPAAGRRTP